MKMGNESEINIQDGKIPELEKMDFSSSSFDNELYKLFFDSTDYHELVVEATRLKKVAVLDVFNETMQIGDSRLSLLSNEYFRLSQENKYLSFFERVFEINDNEAYIDLGGEDDKSKITKIMDRQCERLDKIDRLIYVNQIDVLNNGDNYIYKIGNINLLKLFIKGFLREKIWNSLYFNSHPMILLSNYDLSLPIIIDNNKDKQLYEKIANENNLFFR
ncbi:hypothetical protein ACHEVJ_06870 [Enterococcus raffinosus]|uniref:Uncharacterized protein n=1 Tax=Enterococcus raffinosus TaxID=71452 RepID=A0AAW8SSL4_9ENTE|nr:MULTISPECIES: hypothetical protein [Enterococcus]MBS6430366.1 hypothetical protein [Enterococcus raffinosus]MDK7989131.1 hypothetical protein [Enterococcus raffinosus]MDT2536754.1 hypothetical protein [Enterococcus raffinosus]MDT2570574.1 hypothetical protein [Enterococcus raffinosus]OFT87382.1 hypothetical protein HMPREF3100_07715 [Enterococcus sp. HMSC29A04]